jgi:predicted flap endonuclease-1-like 5' DNA nuclease
LKRGGRSQSAINRCVHFVKDYETFLLNNRVQKNLVNSEFEDLEAYVESVEATPKVSAKTNLWALWYYFDFIGAESMRDLAAAMRGERIKRKPFLLKDFRGVDDEYAELLKSVGVTNVKQMLAAGQTKEDRKRLSEETDVPLDAIEEFVKLSDLARIPGVKTIRARLYHDAGVDTVEKLAAWNPEELRKMLIDFVDQTGFEGMAPLLGEARHAVKTARNLPRVVEYETLRSMDKSINLD